jgi:hypothetical protein
MIPPEKQPQNYVDPQQMIKDMLMEKHAYQRGYADAVDQMERDKKAQPKRQWVGLTDEEMAELRRNGLHEISDKHFRAIEAKLKEKNT